MRTLLLIILTTLSLTLFSYADTQAPEQKKSVLAVLPFENSIALKDYEGLEAGLADLTVNSFFETRRFLLVERSRLDAVLNELKLNLTGIVSSENAVSLGRQLGADYVFIGTIVSINPIHERKSLGVAWTETKGFEVTVQGRIVEIERGVIAASATASGTDKQTRRVAFGASMGSIAPQDTLIKRALQQAVQQIASQLSGQM